MDGNNHGDALAADAVERQLYERAAAVGQQEQPKMTLPLFPNSVPLPAHPTETQLTAAAQLQPRLPRIAARCYGAIVASGRWGATPGELAEALNLDKVTCRARCTELLQAGRVVRTARSRENQLVFVSPGHWTEDLGVVGPRYHKGRP